MQGGILTSVEENSGGDLKYHIQGNLEKSDQFSCNANRTLCNGLGYSTKALVVLVICGGSMLLICLLIAGIRTYPAGMPIGGTNSAVISAACHVRYNDQQEKDDEDITVKPLQWGGTQPGHWSFSSGKVEQPQVGCEYA